MYIIAGFCMNDNGFIHIVGANKINNSKLCNMHNLKWKYLGKT